MSSGLFSLGEICGDGTYFGVAVNEKERAAGGFGGGIGGSGGSGGVFMGDGPRGDGGGG